MMMRTLKRWLLVPAAIAAIVTPAGAALGETLTLSPGFEDPTVVSGTSGGSETQGNCGNISASPEHTLTLTEDFAFLRVSVSAPGQPTLLVEGPGGSFCAPQNPQQSGYWEAGTYSIYVGDRAGGAHEYTLTITTQQ